MADNKINYMELAREILKKAEPSLRLAMAVQFAGYHPEQVTRLIMPRSDKDITLIL